MLGLMLALPLASAAQSPKLGLETLCDHDTVFVHGQIDGGLAWLPTKANIARIPIRQTCWLRLTRPAAEQIQGDANDQFLVFENSWGSNFSLYDPSGKLLAQSSIDGDRFRVVVDKRWIYFALTANTPNVLYARV